MSSTPLHHGKTSTLSLSLSLSLSLYIYIYKKLNFGISNPDICITMDMSKRFESPNHSFSKYFTPVILIPWITQSFSCPPQVRDMIYVYLCWKGLLSLVKLSICYLPLLKNKFIPLNILTIQTVQYKTHAFKYFYNRHALYILC